MHHVPSDTTVMVEPFARALALIQDLFDHSWIPGARCSSCSIEDAN